MKGENFMLYHAISALANAMQEGIEYANTVREKLENGCPIDDIAEYLHNYHTANAIIDEMKEELRQLKNVTVEKKRNNCGVKEVRTMTAEELRSLCICNNWYTWGTNEEYANLLSMVGNPWEPVNLTTEKLHAIAADILDHSEGREGEDITCVMFELAEAATVCFDFE